MNVNGARFSSSDGVGDDIMTNNATTNGPAPIAVYLYAGDQIIENVTTGYLYFQDSLGNTSHVTDSTGNLKESYTYSAFGTPYFYYPNDPTHNPRNTSAFGIRHLFQGQLWTQEIGLNDYRNRVELPTMGVFLQPDPVGLQFEGEKLLAWSAAYYWAAKAPEKFTSTEMNLYRYCGNDPVDKSDPLGLDSLNLYAPGSEDSQAADLRGIKPKEVTVGGHGSNQAIVDWRSGSRAVLTDKQLANEIRGLSDYTTQKPVRLYNCDAGQGPNSPAERLSKLIPNPVIASTKDTEENLYRSPKTGRIVKSDTPHPVDGGKWVTYQNGRAMNSENTTKRDEKRK